MSKPKPTYPDWFVHVWEHGLLVLMLVGFVFMIAVAATGYFVDTRLSHIEEELNYDPPRSYEKPDLVKLAAEPPEEESIVHRRAEYVPAYSHVYYNRGRPYPLETTLSIRNTDSRRPVYIANAAYYDTGGKEVKQLVDRLIRLGPLQTIDFVLSERDSTGGSGANFIVEWLATEEIDEPMIEAVMVGRMGTQAIAFRTESQPLERYEFGE